MRTRRVRWTHAIAKLVVVAATAGWLTACGSPEGARLTLDAITDVTAYVGQRVEVAVTLSDDDPDGVQLTWTCSGTGLLDDANVTWLGSGATRTLRIDLSPYTTGTETLTVHAADADAHEADVSFVLSVARPFDRAPRTLASPDPVASDHFGESVAVSGVRVLIGADDADPVLPTDTGAAYAFRVDDGSVALSGELLASDRSGGDQFGFWVALHDTTAVVGAPTTDLTLEDEGASYTYRDTGSGWVPQTKLIAPAASGYERVGSAVAVYDDLAVVGAPMHDGAHTNQGAAYLFERSGDVWTYLTRLDPPVPEAGAQFGVSVAVEPGRVVVGASGAASYTGRVYVFEGSGTAWGEPDVLKATDGQSLDGLGVRVAVDGDRIVAGAPWVDLGGTDRGAAYVFERGDTGWTQTATLTVGGALDMDHFGISVDVGDDTIVVGAQGRSDVADSAGAAYVFTRCHDGDWYRVTTLQEPTPDAYAYFGRSVALDGNLLVVGAPWSDGVADDEGRAYVYQR